MKKIIIGAIILLASLFFLQTGAKAEIVTLKLTNSTGHSLERLDIYGEYNAGCAPGSIPSTYTNLAASATITIQVELGTAMTNMSWLLIDWQTEAYGCPGTCELGSLSDSFYFVNRFANLTSSDTGWHITITDGYNSCTTAYAENGCTLEFYDPVP